VESSRAPPVDGRGLGTARLGWKASASPLASNARYIYMYEVLHTCIFAFQSVIVHMHSLPATIRLVGWINACQQLGCCTSADTYTVSR
jgi:hypothetical protein